MSYSSNYNLNIRLTALESKVNAGGGGSDLNSVLISGNSAGANDIDLNNNDILLVDNIDVSTINGAAYPPVVPDNLSAVLTTGNTATNSITLNNSGIGTNVINLLPNASATNPQITLTDGTTTNTIDKNGYTTRNTSANLSHFLNFSDASTTGTGSIQKTAGISCNPSTNTVTATNFTGDLTGTSDSSLRMTITNGSIVGGSFLPTFVAGFGTNQIMYGDAQFVYVATSNSLTLSGGAVTASTFTGSLIGNATTATTATNSTNVGITTDNTSGTYYLPFVKTSGTGNKPLFIDDTTGPLTYNPSTATLTTTSAVIPTISSTTVTLNSAAAAANSASRFQQVGLVKLSSATTTFTGTAGSTVFAFTGLFNSSYKSYRIVIEPQTQVSYAAFPSYALQGFSGTGTLPTIGSLFGYETLSSAPTIVSPVFTSGATLSATPLIFSAPTFINSQTVFDLENVGSIYVGNNQVSLKCSSEYNDTVTTGSSDRTISVTGLNGSTITGLSFSQSTIGLGNAVTIQITVYGLNKL